MRLRRRVPSGWARRAMQFGQAKARQEASLAFARGRAEQLDDDQARADETREHGHPTPRTQDTAE